MKARAAGKTYNPILKYEALGPEIKAICKDLEKVRSKLEKCERSLLAPYQLKKINSLFYLLKLFRMREKAGKDLRPKPLETLNGKQASFEEKITKLYGNPSETLLRTARNNLRRLKEVEELEHLDSKALREAFEKKIRFLGLDWKLRSARSGGAKLAVNSFRREIYIDSSARFPKNSLKRYLCHEIGGHVFRAENGKIQPFSLFRSGFPAYGETEEGLAVYNEYRSGFLDSATLKKYSARVVAAAECKENSFSELFEAFLPYFPPDTTYSLIQRVKRGLSDTALPGGYTKDYIYLSGYEKLRTFLENQKSESEALKVLYCGKIGLEHFKLTQSLLEAEVLKPPRFFPEFEKTFLENP